MSRPPDKAGGGPPYRKPANKLAATTRTSSSAVLAAPNTGRRYWARRMIDRAKGAPLPVYGDATWLTLPDGDPIKVAAVVVAAGAWAQNGDDIPGRLTVEVAASSAAHKQAEDEGYADRAAAHREQWAGRTPRKSFMERRREQLEDAKPRPGDYPGHGTAS